MLLARNPNELSNKSSVPTAIIENDVFKLVENRRRIGALPVTRR
jgi:hypothetical protein